MTSATMLSKMHTASANLPPVTIGGVELDQKERVWPRPPKMIFATPKERVAEARDEFPKYFDLAKSMVYEDTTEKLSRTYRTASSRRCSIFAKYIA